MRVTVQEIMTRDPKFCDPCDTLTAAARRMWDADCGILPIVQDGEVVGVITDRDICMALALTGESRAHEREVAEVATRQLWTCSPQEEVTDALSTMARYRVRRLPVVEQGRLVGLLSVNDVIVCGGENHALRQPLLSALETICAHRSLPVRG